MKFYLSYLKKNSYSINTIKTYKSVLSIYWEYMHDIRNIKRKLKNRFGVPNTAWLHYNVISSYLKWSRDKRIIQLKQLNLPGIPKKYFEVFTKKFIYKKTDINENDDSKNISKKITIRFLFETGIRASELKNYKKIAKDTILVNGKGNKQRHVFCNENTLKNVEKFEFSTKTLRIWVKEILGTKFTPHSIRRSLATHLLIKGASPKMVMLQLGHEKIETTFKYLHLSKNQNKKIYKKYY